MTILLSDSFTGTNGAAPDSTKWSVMSTAQGASAGTTLKIQSNRLLATLGTVGGYGGRAPLRMLATHGNNLDVTGTVNIPNSTSDYNLEWVFAADANIIGSSGYSINTYMYGQLTVQKLGGATGFTGVNNAAIPNYTVGADYRWHIKKTAGLIQFNVWLATASEPGTWMFSQTDTNPITSGYLGIIPKSGDTAGGSIIYDDVVVTDGVTVTSWPVTASGTVTAKGTVTATTQSSKLTSIVTASAVANGYEILNAALTSTVTANGGTTGNVVPQPLAPLTRYNSELRVNGKYFRIAGMNFYDAIFSDNLSTGNGMIPLASIRSTLDVLKAMGHNAIRIHTLFTNYGKPGTMLPSVGNYNEAMLVQADNFLYECQKRGMYVMAPMTDRWDFYHGGGISFAKMYLGSNATLNDFYTNATVFAGFQSHISTLMNRVNTITGTQWKDDTTLAIVETGNEIWDAPQAWSDNTINYLKNNWPQKLVADGSAASGETQYTKFQTSTMSINNPNCDIVGAHYYDDHRMDIPQLQQQVAWATAANKVFITGEFDWRNALQNTGDPAIQNSGTTRAQWFAALEANGAGDFMWTVTTGVTAGHNDGYQLLAEAPQNGEQAAAKVDQANHTAHMIVASQTYSGAVSGGVTATGSVDGFNVQLRVNASSTVVASGSVGAYVAAAGNLSALVTASGTINAVRQTFGVLATTVTASGLIVATGRTNLAAASTVTASGQLYVTSLNNNSIQSTVVASGTTSINRTNFAGAFSSTVTASGLIVATYAFPLGATSTVTASGLIVAAAQLNGEALSSTVTASASVQSGSINAMSVSSVVTASGVVTNTGAYGKAASSIVTASGTVTGSSKYGLNASSTVKATGTLSAVATRNADMLSTTVTATATVSQNLMFKQVISGIVTAGGTINPINPLPGRFSMSIGHGRYEIPLQYIGIWKNGSLVAADVSIFKLGFGTVPFGTSPFGGLK
jgi:hypothetical protein